MHVPSLLPASIRRAFFLIGLRLRALVGETPLLFFGIVIGVALAFRVAVGWAREAPPPIAPTFVTTGPEPGLAPTPTPTSTSTPSAVGDPRSHPPLPAHVAPRPRGHGRRSP